MRDYEIIGIGDMGACDERCESGDIVSGNLGDLEDPFGVAQGIVQFMSGSPSGILDPYKLGKDVGSAVVGKMGDGTGGALSPATSGDVDTPRVRVNVDDSLKVHDAPSVNAPTVGQLSPGQIVTLTGRSSDVFYEMKADDGLTGWVASRDPNGTKRYLLRLNEPYTPKIGPATATVAPSPKDALMGLGWKGALALAAGVALVGGGIYYAVSD
jgi:SH3 domain-containing protein